METREQNVPLNQTSEFDVSPSPVLPSNGEGSEWKPSPPLTKSSIRINPSKVAENPFIETASTVESHQAIVDEPVVRPTVVKRKPILSEEAPAREPREEAGARQPTSYIVNAPKPVNQRRSKHVLNFIVLLFALNLLSIAAFGIWFYNTMISQVEARLGKAPTQQSNLPVNKSSTSQPGNSSEGDHQQVAHLQEVVSDLQAQIQAAQKRLDTSEQTTQKLTARLQDQAGNSNIVVKPALPAGGQDSMPTQSLGGTADSELVLLKERNRLTSYADEAIATGERLPYEKLWEALDDKRLSNLVHAARAEILRVQNYYLSGSRLESFDIPVGDYYPDSANLRDSQLDDSKLIELLQNQDNPWQVRLKSANLLGLRRSTAVGDALVKTIKSDSNLDVVKEATFSFEQITGYRAKLFETASLEAWWTQYNDAPVPQPSPPAKQSPPPAPAPAKDDKEKEKKPAAKTEEKNSAKESEKDKPAAKPAEEKSVESKKEEAPQGTQPELKLPVPELRVPEETPAAQ